MNICTRTCKSVYVSYVYQKDCVSVSLYQCLYVRTVYVQACVHVYNMQEMHRQIFTLSLLMIAVASEHHAKMSNRYLYALRGASNPSLAVFKQLRQIRITQIGWFWFILLMKELLPALRTTNSTIFTWFIHPRCWNSAELLPH